MLDEKLKDQLIQEIIKELQPAFIILFGSFAKGVVREDSDIDLAYFSDRALTNYERFILANKLAQLVGREVDLADIKQIDTVFNVQIFHKGTPIYITDENVFITQRIRAYRMYADLNERRAPVLDAVKKSGRVFNHE